MGSTLYQVSSVLSLNVRGILNKTKRQTILKYIKEKQIDIVCMQETYICHQKYINNINREWAGLSFHATSTSNHSRGILILLQKSFCTDLKIIDKWDDNNARCLIVNLEKGDSYISLVSLYSPNSVHERINFFHSLDKWIAEKVLNFNCLILCGDFNCSLEKRDRRKEFIDNSSKYFKALLSRYSLCDVWRYINKDSIDYTYISPTGSDSRIEYIFFSKSLVYLVADCKNLKIPKAPDHKGVLKSEMVIGK